MPGPFQLRDYATFTGPLQKDTAAYDFESTFEEGFWHTDIPTDTSYEFSDVGMIFFKNPGDYAYFHLYGSDTSVVTLEKNNGDLPNLIANIENTIFNGKIVINDNAVCNGQIVANEIVLCNNIVNLAGVGDAASYMIENRNLINTKKAFDISHPSKENHRLRYICVEGPTADVYVRGKLKDKSVIELPEYWRELVDAETIDVVLTPIGSYQELFVERIDWGTKVIVKNNAGGPINCSYVVYGERKDVEKNISEYEGTSPNDYPGDNSQYAINII